MLINNNAFDDAKVQFRIRVKEKIYNEITEYCQFAKINERDFFIEQACRFIFKNDEEWQKFKNL